MRRFKGTEAERARWRDEKRRERATKRAEDTERVAEQERLEVEARRLTADRARRVVLADAVCRKCGSPLIWRPDAYRRRRVDLQYPPVVAARCAGCGGWSHVAVTRHDAGESVAWEVRPCKTAYLYARMRERIASRRWKREVRQDARAAARVTPARRPRPVVEAAPETASKTPRPASRPRAAASAPDPWFAVRYY